MAATQSLASRLLRVLRGVVAPVLILVVASAGFVGWQTSHSRALSPYDEYVYVDYLAKVPTEGVVRTGEETGDIARQALACLGVQWYTIKVQPCRGTDFSDDKIYPYAGHTGADIYTPVYFAVTWALAQPLTWAGLDLVDAGRLVGAFWLALGTVGVWLLVRLLRIDPLYGLALGLLVIATPAVYWSTTYISTDAPSLAAGAWVGCLGVWAWMRRRAALVLLPLAAILVVLIKVQNLAAVGAVGLALLVGVIVERSTPDRPLRSNRFARIFTDGRSLSAIAAVVLALCAQVAWLAYRSAIKLPGTTPGVDTVRQPLSLHALVTESFRFLTSVGGPVDGSGALGFAVSSLLVLLTIGSLVGLVVGFRVWGVRGLVIAGALLLVALLLGPALAFFTRLTVGYYTPLSDRYGLSLLGLFLAVIALYLFTALGGRSGLGAVGALGRVDGDDATLPDRDIASARPRGHSQEDSGSQKKESAGGQPEQVPTRS